MSDYAEAEILQNSQENTCSIQENTCFRVSLVIKLDAVDLKINKKRDCSQDVFLWILRYL